MSYYHDENSSFQKYTSSSITAPQATPLRTAVPDASEEAAGQERRRLHELHDLGVLDTEPEQELDEMVEVAATLLNTPIALVSLVAEQRQWFKARVGLEACETNREVSFCQYTIPRPDEVLVVEDAQEDARFCDNALVTGPPYIRFYAGAPLVTPSGEVLGALCIIDQKPRQISERQKRALQILARKAMNHLQFRKFIPLHPSDALPWNQSSRLRELMDLAPGFSYQFRMDAGEACTFPFVTAGVEALHPELTPQSLLRDARLAFKKLHPEDMELVWDSLKQSFNTLEAWNVEFRTIQPDGSCRWFLARATPELQRDHSVLWYGNCQNITARREYERSMEQIAFDISHVLRRPVTSLLALAELIESDDLDAEEARYYIKYIKGVSEELERFTRRLHDVYAHKSEIIRNGGSGH